jgi:ABC-2 type transport system ATP-binding protein
MSTATPFALETRELTKRFGNRLAVDGVDLRIPSGCAFGYLGPNGAGKTTLIRMLLGLTRPSAGSMRLLGRPLPARRAEALARTAAIVEEPRFHPYLTGRENLQIAAAAREREAHSRIDGVLARVGLADRAKNRVSSYSLGMRQRLGIARCLLADPELLILDEPMNGLDPAGMEEIRGTIRHLVGEGRTVVLSSHLLDEVEKTCDAVAIVDHGRVVVQGNLDELVRSQAPALVVASNDNDRACSLLEEVPSVIGVEHANGALRVRLRLGPEAAAEDASAEVNRSLVEAGVSVHRLEPERISLEERFLELTSRLGAVA